VNRQTGRRLRLLSGPYLRTPGRYGAPVSVAAKLWHCSRRGCDGVAWFEWKGQACGLSAIPLCSASTANKIITTGAGGLSDDDDDMHRARDILRPLQRSRTHGRSIMTRSVTITGFPISMLHRCAQMGKAARIRRCPSANCQSATWQYSTIFPAPAFTASRKVREAIIGLNTLVLDREFAGERDRLLFSAARQWLHARRLDADASASDVSHVSRSQLPIAEDMYARCINLPAAVSGRQ